MNSCRELLSPQPALCPRDFGACHWRLGLHYPSTGKSNHHLLSHQVDFAIRFQASAPHKAVLSYVNFFAYGIRNRDLIGSFCNGRNRNLASFMLRIKAIRRARQNEVIRMLTLANQFSFILGLGSMSISSRLTAIEAWPSRRICQGLIQHLCLSPQLFPKAL